MTTKKPHNIFSLSIFSWILFDCSLLAFHAVIVTFVFSTYFTQKVAMNPIIGTHQWGVMMGVAGLLISLLSPVLGTLGDYYRFRKPWLGLFSLITVLSCTLLWFVDANPASSMNALILVGVGLLGVELGVIFYNGLLADIAPKPFLGRLSGIGWGAGYLGGILCLLFVLVFLVRGQGQFFHLESETYEHIRAVGPFVALWFVLFSLPLFFWTDEKLSAKPSQKDVFKGFSAFYRSFKIALNYPQIILFLLANMLYMDGLKTIFAFGGIFASGTFGFSIDQVIWLGVFMNICAGIGAIGFSWLDDLWGSKKTIQLSLFFTICVAATILVTSSKSVFTFLALVMSLFLGPIQASSRALILKIAPQEITTQMLGLFNFSGRVTAFIGPWLFGALTFAFDSQRFGMIVPIVFLLLGFGVLSFLYREVLTT